MTNDPNTVDLLQIRIENAKEKLPVETTNAIAAVDWRAAIMGIREKKGYNFEQLGDLELETELLLCGLTSSADYAKELQTRMRISKAETDELVNQMNELVFSKIKAELIKNTERKKMFVKSSEKNPDPETILKSAGIEIEKPMPARNASQGDAGGENREEMLKKIEHPTPTPTRVVEPMLGEPETPRIGALHPLLTQKILGSIQVPIVKTEHTLNNISSEKPDLKQANIATLKADPYRETPE